ncbi:unnamed protein product [Orchesella dallaii]|uniref:C2H2-type domain-containing protein n=1 Tax=Orchesella dallaii TaxID=48710 RepID=A0ABP1PZC5_9HEXA
MSAAHAKGDVNLQSMLNERSPPPLPKELKWYEDEHVEAKRRELADYKCAICKACITDGDVDGWCYMLRASNKCPPSHGYCVRCRPASVRKPNGKSVCYCPGTECNVLYVLETARLDPVPDNIWKEAQLLQNEAYDQREQERDALRKEEREKELWQRGGVKKCRFCLKDFKTCYMKETHIREVHRIGVLKCEYCGQEFTTHVALKHHGKDGCAKMRKRWKYFCSRCHKAFKGKNFQRDILRHAKRCDGKILVSFYALYVGVYM